MAGLGSFQVSKPMSVKEISVKAEDFDFNPFIPMKYWFRTADTLLREVGAFSGLEASLVNMRRRKSTNKKKVINKPTSSSCDMRPSSQRSFHFIRLRGIRRIARELSQRQRSCRLS